LRVGGELTKKKELITSLYQMTSSLSEYGLIRTECVLSSILENLQKPTVTLKTVVEDFDYAPSSLIMEINDRYPSHYAAIQASSKEFTNVLKRAPVENPKLVWDSLEERATLYGLGNIIADKANQGQDPVVKTLLHCLNVIALYEVGKANYCNYINSTLRHYKNAIEQESDPIIETALTLRQSHMNHENEILIRKSVRCEICRMRNGIAHFRYDISPEGALHVWDIGYNKKTEKKERIFDETYSLRGLVEIICEFQIRIVLIDILAYLIVVKSIMLGENGQKYLT
jgi:hypothetical protein